MPQLATKCKLKCYLRCAVVEEDSFSDFFELNSLNFRSGPNPKQQWFPAYCETWQEGNKFRLYCRCLRLYSVYVVLQDSLW